MIETTTTRPNTAEVTQRAGDARHRPLPPGQRAIDWFPRFGTDLGKPAPISPTDPVVEIGGAVTGTFAVPVAELATLPRRRLDADFHCVSGWTAVDLHWEGVAFAEFYRLRIEPTTAPRHRRHPRRVPRPRRLPIGHHDRGRAQRRRAPRRSPRRRTARQRPRRTTQARQPGTVRLHEHEAPLSHRPAHRGTDRRPPIVRARRAAPLPSQSEGLGGRAPRHVARPGGPTLLPSRRNGHAAPQQTAIARGHRNTQAHAIALRQTNPHQDTVWVATWYGSGRAAPGSARLPPVRLFIALSQST